MDGFFILYGTAGFFIIKRKNCFSPIESSPSGHDHKPLHYKALLGIPIPGCNRHCVRLTDIEYTIFFKNSQYFLCKNTLKIQKNDFELLKSAVSSEEVSTYLFLGENMSQGL